MPDPLQVIGPPDFEFTVYDLCQVAASEQFSRLNSLFEEMRLGKMEIKGAGMRPRVAMMRFADDCHALLLAALGLCADRRSLELIVRSILEPDMDAEPVQYADAAGVMAGILEGPESHTGRTYWREQCRTFTNSPNGIGAGHSLVAFAPRRLERSLASEVLAHADAVSRAAGSSRRAFFFACMQALRVRVTEDPDRVTTGLVCNGRTDEALSDAIGLFEKYVPAPLPVYPGMKFLELLGLATSTLETSERYQEDFDPALLRDGGFDWCYEYVADGSVSNPANAAYTIQKVWSATGCFKFRFSLQEGPESLTVSLDYDSSRVSSDAAERLAWQFLTVCRSATDTVCSTVEDLRIIPNADVDLLARWQGKLVEWPAETFCHIWFEQQTARSPHRVAVVFDDQHLSYSELMARTNRLSHRLVAQGAGPDVRIGLCLERSLDMVIGLLGILMAGAAYVPLDPAYPTDRLSHILTDSHCSIAVTGAIQRSLLPPGINVLEVDADPSWMADRESGILPPQAIGANLAYILYTSGSTGAPKGVAISHAALANHMLWILNEFCIDGRDRVVQKTPFSFDASVWEFHAALMSGGALVMAKSGGHQESDYLVELMEREQITILQTVPSLLTMLVAQPGFERCKALRTVFCGGEPLDAGLAASYRQTVDAPLVNLYGPTEATIDSTFCFAADFAERDGVPIGTPVTNVQAYMLDRRFQQTPVGVAGELFLGGAALARGYIGKPAATAERFLPNPFSSEPGARVYKTGDRARWLASGDLEFLGRVDRQVKFRGHRIELGEIEKALTSHPGVNQAVVLLHSKPDWDDILTAYVVPFAGTQITGPELVAVVRNRLPAYMVPAKMILLDEFPKLPNGKLNHEALPSPDYQQAAWLNDAPDPRDSVEAHLKQIWQEVLGGWGVGIRDDFFELGGHSLTALVLSARLEREYGARVPVSVVFAHPTVEQMATFLRQEGANISRSSLVPIHAQGSRPPLFCVHPAGGLVHCYVPLSRHLGRDYVLYGLQSIGFDEGQTPVRDLKEMAAHYVESIRSIQASGPYRIVGWSMGASLAFEMARQLVTADASVAFVGLLDGRPNRNARVPDERAFNAEVVQKQDELINELARVELGIKFETEPFEERVRRYLDGAKAIDKVPSDITERQYLRFLQVMATNEIAALGYAPEPAAIRVSLFRTESSDNEDSAYGWQRLALSGVDVYRFPARHREFVSGRHLQSLADRIRACLDACE
jgi:amino acid adenylation domain-containing protein